MKFVMATHNAKKLKEMNRILSPLDIEIVSADFPDVDETGTTFAENAYLKAKSACDYTGYPAIADDSGLSVDALNGEPGIYSARYGGDLCKTDEDRVAYLLKNMESIPDRERTARFVCSICCVFPNGDKITAEDSCEGVIGYSPVGENGFGYDPVFMRGERSFAQFTSQEKDEVSHRGKAMRDFYNKLEDYMRGER